MTAETATIDPAPAGAAPPAASPEASPVASGVAPYLAELAAVLAGCEASDGAGRALPVGAAVERVIALAHRTQAAGNTLLFIGNGGSAGIASHLAIDFTKNGGMRALAFNDPAALTCLGNDFGYDQVFARQIAAHGRPGDLLVAISSSGRSANILNGVAAARRLGIGVVGLSGFGADNPLRRAGDINFYLPSGRYGFVEIGHLALAHMLLDLASGWVPADSGGETGR